MRRLFFMENQTSAAPEQPENQVTERLSSNSTLFWRVFVPVFGTVFMSGFLLAFLLIPGEELLLPFPVLWGRIAVFFVWIGWFLLVRRTLWRLKRVDVNAHYLFVTNYWVTLRYPWSEVESMDEVRRAGRRVVNVGLRASGRFGRKISFLPNDRYDEWHSLFLKAKG